MMDIKFGNKKFPFRWRSSLAISAFEPDSAAAPTSLCEGRLTLLKLTATITGYQPTPEETRQGFASFPNVPTEELQRIIGQYFACYGALVTVAVFPHKSSLGGAPLPSGTKLEDFPHILDVEPKTRDLIQAATETGEILTTSKSNIKTNKSLTHTESSETGFTLTGLAGQPDVAPNQKKPSNVTAQLSHKNTESEQENWSVATDASRERQEKEGTVTQVSQLYNLLSSYHVGTNRAQFLMLARPHVLDPTDHRTFVNGLRQIEGVQEFILIVARPPGLPGLCVEAQLETGHFPEGLIVEEPGPQFDESHEEFKVTKFVDDGIFSGSCSDFETTHDVLSGWVVDTRPERGPDPGHEGMKEIANNSNGRANESLENYNYRRIADATVSVSGRVCSSTFTEARFNRTYRVFTRSIAPKPVSGSAHVPMERLLITSRNLNVCFLSAGPEVGCPIVDPVLILPDEAATFVAEIPISIPARVLPVGGSSPMPAAAALLSKVRSAMTTSWRMPQRRAADEAPGFLESDYFKDQIRRFLPRDHLRRNAVDVAGLGTPAADRLGRGLTVADALDLDLTRFSEKAGLTMPEAIRARRALLGIPEATTAN
jgi:hypothetical protein